MPTGLISLDPPDEQGWMVATGEGLPQPLKVRFDYRAGRFQLTGLRMESGQPITAAVLRSIPVGELVAAYLPRFRDQFQDLKQQVLESDFDAAKHRQFGELLAPMLRIAVSGEAAVLTKRSRGAKPPTDAEYRAFARIYLEERAVGERGALSRTAKRLDVHRSTALRWLRNMPMRLPEGGTTNDKN